MYLYHMKYILLFAACFCLAQSASACRCMPLPALDSLSQLKDYDFIARVKIVKDGGQVTGGNRGRLKIKVVERFKGKRRTVIYEMAKGTSCDMFITKGQEWLVFGKMENGRLVIGPCDRNVMYRTGRNSENAVAGDRRELLEKLREFYGRDAS
jgi:hypothetical protein